MKLPFLLPLLCLGAMAQAYAETPTSACTFVSAADIDAAFGKAVKVTGDTPEACDYEDQGFSVRVMHIDYATEDMAKGGFKTLFAGKKAIDGLGDEASSLRQGREIDKVSMRQGLHVLSISKMGGELGDDDLKKLETLLRQAAGKLSGAAEPASTLDAACDPLIKASEAKIAQAAWHTVVDGGGIKLESITVDGQSFMSMDGKWMKSPISLADAEKTAIKQIQEGTLKVSDCKDGGMETVDGMEMNVFSYATEDFVPGNPAVMTKLYIGKEDGLPYQSVDKDGKTAMTIRYKDVVAPKL